MDYHEKGIILEYYYRLVDYAGNRRKLFIIIFNHLLESDLLYMSEDEILTDINALMTGKDDRIDECSQEDYVMLVTRMKYFLCKAITIYKNYSLSRTESNLEVLSTHLGLDELEKKFLNLILHHCCCESFRIFLNEITRDHIPTMDACAVVLGVKLIELEEHLHSNSQLCLLGIIRFRYSSGSDLDDFYKIFEVVRHALIRPPSMLEALLEIIVLMRQSKLPSDDSYSRKLREL